jgi:chaperonin GroES
MSKVPLNPLGARVIATREAAASKTKSGLYLPDNAKEKSQIVDVVAVGPEVKSLKAGDRAIVREYSTTEVKVDGVEYLIVKDEDILATVEK